MRHEFFGKKPTPFLKYIVEYAALFYYLVWLSEKFLK